MPLYYELVYQIAKFGLGLLTRKILVMNHKKLFFLENKLIRNFVRCCYKRKSSANYEYTKIASFI